MRTALVIASAFAVAFLSPARAVAGDVGVAALLTLDGSLSHGGGFGTTLNVETHLGSTALRASVSAASFMSFIDQPEVGESRLIAGGTLLAPTLGVRQTIQLESKLQPWVAAGLGYGWFWFDEDDRANSALGIDAGRAAWYLEAGSDAALSGTSSGPGLTFSLRALSSPVGMLWMFSFAAFWDER